MAFTVIDFQDLISLLEQRPEWRSSLRRLVLSDELLELPAMVQGLIRAVAELRGTVSELAAAQQRTDAGLAELRGVVVELADAQRRTEAGLDELRGVVAELAAAQQRTEARLDELRGVVRELVDAQRRTVARLDRLDSKMDDFALAQQRFEVRMDDFAVTQLQFGSRMDSFGLEQQRMRADIGNLLGEGLERHYRENAGALFDDIVRRPAAISKQRLADLLDAADAPGTLSRAERRDVLVSDLVVRGRRPDDGQEVYLVVEVSVGIGVSDVERAARRAELLGRLHPTLPVVAGERALPDAVTAADERGVWRLLGGTAFPPAGL